MDVCEVLNTLVTYFNAEIKNQIVLKDNELIVELADKSKVKISVKV